MRLGAIETVMDEVQGLLFVFLHVEPLLFAGDVLGERKYRGACYGE